MNEPLAGGEHGADLEETVTSQRLVEEFARWLWRRDQPTDAVGRALMNRVPDSYLNEAAIFLAGPLGQRLQRAQSPTSVVAHREDFSQYLEDERPHSGPNCPTCHGREER